MFGDILMPVVSSVLGGHFFFTGACVYCIARNVFLNDACLLSGVCVFWLLISFYCKVVLPVFALPRVHVMFEARDGCLLLHHWGHVTCMMVVVVVVVMEG